MARAKKRKHTAQHKRNLLSYFEAFEETGVRPDTWRKWVAQGRISVVRLGRLVKIPRSVVDQFIKENTVAASRPSKVSRGGG
jgi:excisionase family DNA binding protein